MKKCIVCQAPTNDMLAEIFHEKIFFGRNLHLVKKMKSYCRPHLIAEFKLGFLSARQKMIVIDPEWDAVKEACLYGCLGTTELKESNDGEPFVWNIFLSINGPCCSCGKPGSVAYYARGEIKRLQTYCGNYPDLWHPPVSSPATLCTNCAFNRIEQSLTTFAGEFNEGLFLPYDEECVYCSASI